MTPPITGHCLCGATRYEASIAPIWQSHCHCDSCRRATGAAFASFFGFADGSWQWCGAAPATYQSSADVWRDFCATCGTPMTYRSDRCPGETHFYVGTLDDPSAYLPTEHGHSDQMVPWLHLADGLPRL